VTITVGGNTPPTAVATGSPTSGNAPLTVNFDGSGSFDPDVGDTITYSWDLNGDGTFGDSTAQKPSFTYTSAGTYNAKLKVTDTRNASTTSGAVTITVTGAPPSTFGTTTPGSLADNMDLNYKEVSKFTAPAAGNVVKVSGYLSGLGKPTGSEKVRAIIYADSGGNPGARLGVSNEVTINAGRAWGWVDFTFSSPVAIPAGPIWLGYFGGGTRGNLIQMRFDQIVGDLRFNKDTYGTTSSNPFGAATAGNFHYSIYASYG
jgi:hypothetical protein